MSLLPGYPVIPDERARYDHLRLRRRLMSGAWAEDLRRIRSQLYDPTSLRAQGPGDTTKNIFRSTVHQLAALYDRPPVAFHTDAGGQALIDQVEAAGLWPLRLRAHRGDVAYREGWIRVDYVPDGDGRLLFRYSPPDLVKCIAPPDDPDTPHTVYEYRIREGEWTRDCISVADPGNPIYRIENEDGSQDISDRFGLGGLSGSGYPWRLRDGTPILPGWLYHAERSGCLWDSYEGSELVTGSLTVAALWSFWGHLVREASWPQRWIVNGQPAGGLRRDQQDEGLAYIPTDPASILAFSSTDPTVGVSVGQFQPGGDPKTMGEAIRDYAGYLALDYGISPTDIDRTTGNAQSGFAIQLSRDGVRSAQRRYLPEAKRGDEAMLRIAAAVWNSGTGQSAPESGYVVKHQGLPRTVEEERFHLERMQTRMAMGLASKVDVYMELHDVPREMALQRLIQIELDQSRFEPGVMENVGPGDGAQGTDA